MLRPKASWHTISHRKGNIHQDSELRSEAVPPTMPAPPYRHAAPSGPWPWMDLKNIDDVDAMHDNEIDKSWQGYPQNQFGNWSPDQVQRSEMLIRCSKNQSSAIYTMDVLNNGKFVPSIIGDGNPDEPSMVEPANEDVFWKSLQRGTPGGIRVRSFCVHDMTKSTLQMLGTRYNVEPFFFTSSVNWIPSRYQEASIHGQGDHITITLPFVRVLHPSSSDSNPLYSKSESPPSTSSSSTQMRSQHSSCPSSPTSKGIEIDTQAPFPLADGDMLFIDLLAIHMIRNVKTSTIISYHPESTWCQTSAKRLNKLMLLVGSSVYWQNIFTKTEDPTFLFLAILWYALYAWDESFEMLYNHVNIIELEVLHDSRIKLTQQLHILQAHLLHYQSLLYHFKMSVNFIAETSNPAMECESFTDEQRKRSHELMGKECKNLLSEIDRLEGRREMLSSRLKNAMNLAFATVNIEDSAQTRMLTEATVRDSAAMKQISYLTMVFLPASFIASVFGMNVVEINPQSLETLPHYAETTVVLTLLTIYVVITLQRHSSIHRPKAPLAERSLWPILLPRRLLRNKRISFKEGGESEKTVDEKV